LGANLIAKINAREVLIAPLFTWTFLIFISNPIPLWKKVAFSIGLRKVFRKRYEEGSVIRWGIELKETNPLIGTCGVHLINQNHKRAEVDYELDDTYWGKGYASEALQAILTYGFETMQFIRIVRSLNEDIGKRRIYN